MEFLVTSVLKLMGTPSVILGKASMYLKIYLIGNVALFIYMQFTSIFGLIIYKLNTIEKTSVDMKYSEA